MSKIGSGRSRVMEILLDVQASHTRLLHTIDQVQAQANADTLQDLRDDQLYARALQRIEIMQDLPDSQLRGHLNLLAREMRRALRDDLSHTSGDAVRRAVQPIRDAVNDVAMRAHELIGLLGGNNHDADD